MKLLQNLIKLIFCIIYFLTIVGCGNSSTNLQKQDGKERLIISVYHYPMRTRSVYTLMSDTIRVSMYQADNGLDSTIETHKVGSHNFNYCKKIIHKFKRDVYTNKCIEDGLVIGMTLNQNSVILKNVRFSNYYHKEFEKIVKNVNQFVRTENKIDYSKSSFLQVKNDCF